MSLRKLILALALTLTASLSLAACDDSGGAAPNNLSGQHPDLSGKG